jgi:uncharacterized repeat protein (TIGR03803 family)
MTSRPSCYAPILRDRLRRVSFALALICALIAAASQVGVAQSFDSIYQFSPQSGWQPWAGVTLDAGGNLYGTTTGGGEDAGTVYQMKRHLNGWFLTQLFVFDAPGGPNSVGSWPWGGIVFGPDGALYGTTSAGGTSNDGVVYRLVPPATTCRSTRCYWTETVLHNFAGGSDGASPALGNVTFDSTGNLYGTTSVGGSNAECQAGCGVVYKLSRSGSGWTEQVVYRFGGGIDGSDPYGTLLVDAAGNIYGTTVMGGGSGCDNQQGCGTVFELSPSGSGWMEKVLYRFQGGNDGASPYGGLIADHSGNLYGAAAYNGSLNGGTVYELSPNGPSWNFSVLHALGPDQYALGGSLGNLAMDNAGALYGITQGDGNASTGSVFKLTPQNGTWTYTLLHSFDDFLGVPRGYEPLGTPVLDSSGNIYGTTSEGGSHLCDPEVYCGTVWEIIAQ